jgi:hypothetical protein
VAPSNRTHALKQETARSIMPDALPCPQPDPLHLCARGEKISAHNARLDADRDARRERRRAARECKRLALRHLSHPGNRVRRGVERWLKRLGIWTVQGTVFALALIIVGLIVTACSGR